MENTKKWVYGTNRWIILGLVVLAIIASSFFPPVQPHILVATEKLGETPLFTLPVIGDFYLTNTLTTLLLADGIIILLALAVRNSARKGGLIPSGIGGAFEAIVEVLYNLAESTAGRHVKSHFPLVRDDYHRGVDFQFDGVDPWYGGSWFSPSCR